MLLCWSPHRISSPSTVDPDMERVLCSLPGGFQDLLPIETLCKFRLRLLAACVPLLQTPTELMSVLFADSCQLMGMPATSLMYWR